MASGYGAVGGVGIVDIGVIVLTIVMAVVTGVFLAVMMIADNKIQRYEKE